LEDRVRTRQRSLQFVIEKISRIVGKRPVNAAVVHSEDPGSAGQLVEMVRAKLNCAELIVTELSTGIAANLGPGTLGIIAYPVK
jgi:fatty acid-binding protein DegV